MDTRAADLFLAGLAERLAGAIGAFEVDAATSPPAGVGVVRSLQPDELRIGDRLLPSTVPRVVLELDPPADAQELCAAWGISRPVAVAADVHQARWRILVAGDELPDPHARRIEARPLLVGRWEVRLDLVDRPRAGLPAMVAGASPAYDLREHGGALGRIEITPAAGRLDLVRGDHPEAHALLAAMAAFYPAWRTGWVVDPGSAFVVVYEGDRAAAGASISDDGRGTATASRICVLPGGVAGAAGSLLLDALEAVALDRGCSRLCLDGSAFLATSEVPHERHGYVVAPPYDGDADESVWTERDLHDWRGEPQAGPRRPVR